MEKAIENEIYATPPRITAGHILLASNSPRRKELLGKIAPSFSLAEARDVDESYPDGMDPQQVPVHISQAKAKAYADLLIDDEIIITADTVVICGDRILGKPHDEAEASAMLHSLSGRKHLVTTGVTLSSKDKTESFAVTTEVEFAELTEKEISEYIEYYRPFDKAGAYGIQEWIGCIGISSITGCFYNVMGLPLHALYRHILNF